MNALISLAVLSLFLPLRLSIGPILLRPFEILVLFICVMTIAIGPRLPVRPRPLTGFYLFCMSAAWHALSAFTVSPENGLRELLQIMVIVAFGWCIIALLPILNLKRIGAYLLIGMAAITTWSIAWHLQHGFTTGWKRLADPKTTFTFLPAAIGCALLFSSPNRKRLYVGIWVVLGLITILSGERKALGIYALITGALLARGRFSPVPILIVGALATASLAFLAAGNAYMSTQLQSFVDPLNARNGFDAVARGVTPLSFSNSQRLFAMELGKQLFAESPIIGIGTNGYIDRLARQFYFVPAFLRVGIHGEPLRVLVENGILGLAIYLSFWIASIRGILKSCRQVAFAWSFPPNAAWTLFTILVTPAAFYSLFEGGGTHMFMVALLVTLYPAVLNEVAVRRRPELLQAPTYREDRVAPGGQRPRPLRFR